MSEKKYIHGKDARMRFSDGTEIEFSFEMNNEIEITYDEIVRQPITQTEATFTAEISLTEEQFDSLIDFSIEAGGDILDATVIG
jgi:hypothetical protein